MDKTADDRFERLDRMTRELEEVSGVRLVDIELRAATRFTRSETDEDNEIVAFADVGGVPVEAFYDDEGEVLVFSQDERFVDLDDVLEHVKVDADRDDFRGILDEAAWLRSQHGNIALSHYRDHLRGDT